MAAPEWKSVGLKVEGGIGWLRPEAGLVRGEENVRFYVQSTHDIDPVISTYRAFVKRNQQETVK